MKWIARLGTAAALAAVVAAMPHRDASAAFTFTFTEVANNVVLSGSGTINLAGLSFYEDGEGCTCVEAFSGTVASTLGTTSYFSGTLAGPGGFGPGGDVNADGFLDGSDNVYLSLAAGRIGVPVGYVSGAQLTTEIVFSVASFASMGLTPGTYVYSWGSRTAGDTITVQVGPAPVSEPATALLLGAGLLGLVAARRRGR